MKKNMFFEVVDYSGADGGLYKYFRDYMEDFDSQGFTVLFHSSFSKVSEVKWPSFVNETEAFGNLKSENSKLIKGFYFIKGIFKICSKYKRKQKIINLHVFDFKLFNLFALFIFKLFSYKLILTIHDVEAFRSKDSVFLEKFRIKISYNLANILIIHSEQARLELYKILKKIDKVHEIPMRIKDNHQGNEFLQKGNEFKFLIPGSFKKSKGLETAIEASKLLQKSCNNFSLKIIGKDLDNISNDLIDLKKKLNIDNNLIIENRFLSEEEFNNELFKSNCIILPYKRIYQSHVLLEAISRGIPVIASDHKSFRVILGNNGNYFNSNSSVDLYKSMHYMINNYKYEYQNATKIKDSFFASSSSNDSLKSLTEVILK